jgi:hypothetical protein
MVIFERYNPCSTYKYTEYVSVIEEKCWCGAEIKVTGSENYCDKKIQEFTDRHLKCRATWHALSKK